MNRRALRWMLVLGASGIVLAVAAHAPVLLRRIDAFRVDRVEVVGTRYLAPHEALAASGITRASNIFDDPAPWQANLRAHPLVAAASIERKLPSTLIVRIEEVMPVALVRTPELRPVDANARALPIDPTAADLDLPIIIAASGVAENGALTDSAAIALVRAAVRLRTLQPAIAARVSELGGAPDGSVRLLLREPTRAEVLLPAGLEPERLAQLELTIADLEERAEMRSVRRIDVRFRDQVVVSLIPSATG